MSEPMRALTVKQPKAYLAGVLAGDGWISAGHRNAIQGYLALRVADEDFAEAFAAAIAAGYGVATAPSRDERGYWLTRTYNGYGRFNELLTLEPVSLDETAAWLRGLFDSEGNASLIPKPRRGTRSYGRRVAIYSTSAATLARTTGYLGILEIGTRLHPQRPSAGHKGSRPVSELAVRGSQASYEAFASIVGSSIRRKQAVLDALPLSYVADMSAVRREMQAKGAMTRKARDVY